MSNLIGQKFGRLTVIDALSERKQNRKVWYCRCDCGNTLKVTTLDLRRKSGGTKSCGCLLYDKITEKGRNRIDISGKKYGKLTVICDSGLRKNDHILWKCQCECGNIKNVNIFAAKRGDTVSCGCNKSAKARERGGSKHWNWKGGISYQRDRQDQRYKYWRKSVFERDKYTCLKCNKVGGRLNAHHKEGFNNNEHLRFDINNGATVCENCHNEFHSIYGKMINTAQQFEQFLQG